MEVINLVLTVYCFGCAAIATALLVFVVRFLRDSVLQEAEDSWTRFIERFVYAAIVFIWLMMAYNVLMLI